MIRASADLPEPRRVLIIKPSALGDVVTAVPVLRGLKRTFPEVHALWLVSDACTPLIRHDSQLDEVVPFERRRLGQAWRSLSAAGALARLMLSLHAGRYDWVIDLQGLIRTGLFSAATRAPLRVGFADAREGAWLFYSHRARTDCPHTVDRNIDLARQVGVDARSEDMTLQVSPGGRSFAESFCKTSGLARGSFLIAAAPTTWPTKVYPVRHWRKVVEALSHALPVVLVAPAGDKPLCDAIADGLSDAVVNLAGQTKVDELVGIVSASAGVICSDSAAKFIAPAVGVDCVTLLGPTQAEKTGPYRQGRAMIADVPCQGCLKRKCGHVTCMQSIDPDEVICAAEEMLDKRKE